MSFEGYKILIYAMIYKKVIELPCKSESAECIRKCFMYNCFRKKIAAPADGEWSLIAQQTIDK